MELTEIYSANLPLPERENDVQSVCSGHSQRSRVSRSSAVAHENAKLQNIVSEKKVEQLKSTKARRLKEEQLQLDNEIPEAEDIVEVANTKVQFYEEFDDDLSVEDVEQDENLNSASPELLCTKPKNSVRDPSIVEPNYKLEEEQCTFN